MRTWLQLQLQLQFRSKKIVKKVIYLSVYLFIYMESMVCSSEVYEHTFWLFSSTVELDHTMMLIPVQVMVVILRPSAFLSAHSNLCQDIKSNEKEEQQQQHNRNEKVVMGNNREDRLKGRRLEGAILFYAGSVEERGWIGFITWRNSIVFEIISYVLPRFGSTCFVYKLRIPNSQQILYMLFIPKKKGRVL